MLEVFVQTNPFSKETSPTFILVYAHDAPNISFMVSQVYLHCKHVPVSMLRILYYPEVNIFITNCFALSHSLLTTLSIRPKGDHGTKRRREGGRNVFSLFEARRYELFIASRNKEDEYLNSSACTSNPTLRIVVS